MALIAPKLDDRTFSNLFEEALKRIPQHCKDWTDYNLSDPGVTLIELFAWMTDILLYRLNQVPDLHYIRFMEMLGISLQEPIPATVPVSFWLSQPQETKIVIPAGTEVATTQTETEPSIIFTTDEELTVHPPVLKAVLTRKTGSDGAAKFDELVLRQLLTGWKDKGIEIFSEPPQVNDALYLGFGNDLSHHLLGFDLDFDPAGGAGIDPTLPPYIWEASTGDPNAQWQPCEVEMDSTRGMNAEGRIRIFIPSMGLNKVQKDELYWIRVRNREITPNEKRMGMEPYRKSPYLLKLGVASWGGTVQAMHAQQISREFLGRSNGSAGQRFFLKNIPVLKRKEHETLVVQVNDSPQQRWHEASDFATSDASDQNFTLDGLTGEIRLAPAVREPDGTVKLYGAIPADGANLIFEQYRFGGGNIGNVQAGVLNTLKTSIPYIEKVSNRQSARGGKDAESLESAMIRTPALLRSQNRAVTEDDFEVLAGQALPTAIGRVKCLQPSPSEAAKIIPGVVYVLVIPAILDPIRPLSQGELDLKAEEKETLRAYLNQHRLLTTRIEIHPPAYHGIAVKVKLRLSPEASQEKVQNEIFTRLYRYLNPLTGGQDGDGWPFGRSLYISDVYQCLQGIKDVLFIRQVELYKAEPGGPPQGNPIEIQEVFSHGVIVSGTHKIEFI